MIQELCFSEGAAPDTLDETLPSFLDGEDKEMYKQSIAARLKRLIAERKDV